jgi:hypothetical protein
MPTAFCSTGFSSINWAFIGGLLVDIISQARELLFSDRSLALWLNYGLTDVHAVPQLALLCAARAL